METRLRSPRASTLNCHSRVNRAGNGPGMVRKGSKAGFIKNRNMAITPRRAAMYAYLSKCSYMLTWIDILISSASEPGACTYISTGIPVDQRKRSKGSEGYMAQGLVLAMMIEFACGDRVGIEFPYPKLRIRHRSCPAK
jgi:hypothetical protein